LDVRVAPDNTVIASITGTLYNPSIISLIPLGNLSFTVQYNDSDVGYLRGQQVALYSGINTVTLQGVIAPTNAEKLNEMISQYLLGESFVLKAYGLTTSVALYQPTLGNLGLDAFVHQPRIDLGWQVAMHLEPIVTFKYWNVTHQLMVPTAVKFHNPFSADIYITGIDLYVTYNRTECGFSQTSIDANNTALHILVPGNSTSWSVTVPVRMDFRSGHVKELAKAILTEMKDGYVLLGLYGFVNITVGNLMLRPYYYQPEDIPTCFYGFGKLCEQYEQEHHGS